MSELPISSSVSRKAASRVKMRAWLIMPVAMAHVKARENPLRIAAMDAVRAISVITKQGQKPVPCPNSHELVPTSTCPTFRKRAAGTGGLHPATEQKVSNDRWCFTEKAGNGAGGIDRVAVKHTLHAGASFR